MTTEIRNVPSFSFALYLGLAAVGSYLLTTSQLNSSRPDSSDYQLNITERDHKIPARLWQDPFKIINANTDEIKAKENNGDFYTSLLKNFESQGEVLILATLFSGELNAEIEERRRRRRYAVISGLATQGFYPDDAMSFHVMKIDYNGKEKLIPYEWYYKKTESAKKSVLVLWLNETDFSETPFSSINLLLQSLIPDKIKQLAESKEKDKPDCSKEASFPEKNCWSVFTTENGFRFESETGMNSATAKKKGMSGKICWHKPSPDTDCPEKPITNLKFDCLTEDIKKYRKNTRLVILGPASSSTLNNFVSWNNKDREKENNAISCIKKSGLAGVNILSPAATIPEHFVLNAVPEDKQGRPLSSYKEFLSNVYTCKKGETCLTFFRGILTDDIVIRKLVDELSLRRIRVDKNKNKQSHIVLVTELDTVFGRALPKIFEREFCGEANCDNVTTFNYLRGIDGNAINSRDIGRETDKKSRSDSDSAKNKEANSAIRRPVGTAQFDYMRRLAGNIRKLDKELLHKNGHGIDAIGVLGNDIYDKLLILRLLRQQIPGVLFFTTDLDAELLHPNEYRWTRNLIGASTFTLQLNKDLQNTIPPFRDSYQTSYFLSTQKAVELYINNTDNSDKDWLKNVKPVVYEVASNGVVFLGHEENTLQEFTTLELAGSGFISKTEDNSYIGWLPFLLIAIIGSGLLWYLLPGNTYLQIYYAFSILLLFLVFFIASYLGRIEEPFVMFSGVSIWGSEIVRLIVILLGVYFIIKSATSLKMNWLRLDGRYMNLNEVALPNKCNPMEIIKTPIKQTEEDAATNSAQCEDINSIYLLIVVILMVAFIQGILEYNEYSQWCVFTLWLVFFGIWYVLAKVMKTLDIKTWHVDICKPPIEKPLSNASDLCLVYGKYTCLNSRVIRTFNKVMKTLDIKTWHVDICKPPIENPLPNARDLWLEYGQYTCLKSRVIRTFNMVLVFKIMVSLVHILFGKEAAPIRGETSRAIDMLISIPAEMLTLFLLFFIVDATLLCNTWIKAFTFCKYDWKHTRAGKIAQNMAVNVDDIQCWLKIRIIASRTTEVNRLIYFPVVIIILMLFSRISYFDNWGFPQAQALVVGATILIALITALKLRNMAEKSRRESLKILNDHLIKANSEHPGTHAAGMVTTSVAQIELLIQQTENIRNGAFQPIFEQPFVKAGLLLLGGIGFTASQYYRILGG